ncbi:hypothetical protein MLD38_027068 [Melastoma candidum]|uniref:Uncharacterized protein n=1 Tax=Melastoma candidum TaxID=119954 RepID=A0ACB9P263_9MYRT|nr:hypothetical protein MLD38_027068 [Melastoma candidum]
MGNKLGRRRQVVDDKYTRPQGMYSLKDVDVKKVRKLILDSKLAPCYPGDEESTRDLEECPICFLYFPSLNRSKCCRKRICTECFLQMKAPNSTRPTQCPFCKTLNYAVEYRGVKTKEEKGIEQIEEQRVIEAKIRMRQKELQDEEERMLKRQDLSCSSNRNMVAPVQDENGSGGGFSGQFPALESDEVISADQCYTSDRQYVHQRPNRDDEFDLDLEEIMVMEAIFLSLQDNGKHRGASLGEAASSEHFDSGGRYVPNVSEPVVGSSSSPSGGLACAIAALAERQQVNGEPNVSTYSMRPGCSQFAQQVNLDSDNYSPPGDDGSEISLAGPMQVSRGEWNMDHGSEATEAGTSYASPESTEDTDDASNLTQLHEVGDSGLNLPAPIIPETYEEQMMLAVAVSLAEARAMTSGPGVSWQ